MGDESTGRVGAKLGHPVVVGADTRELQFTIGAVALGPGERDTRIQHLGVDAVDVHLDQARHVRPNQRLTTGEADGLEAVALQIGDRHAEMIELAAGEDVAGERLVFGLQLAEGFFAALGAPRDGVVEIEPTWPEQAMHGAEIGRVVLDPHMLEHADGGDLVELALHLGKVLHQHLDAVLQP